MAHHAEHPTDERDWSWLRISGLSGSFGVHLLALVLLALPIAIPALKPEPAVIHATVRELPAEPTIVEPPPPPVPRRIQHREVVRPAVTSNPVTLEENVLALPVTAPAIEIAEPAMPTGLAGIGPDTATHAGLAYESVTEVRYPMDSRRRGEQGTVVLRVLVGRDGLPVNIAVERSSGHRSLDRAAREAVLRWRFRPVVIDGVPVQASGLVPVKFDISKG